MNILDILNKKIDELRSSIVSEEEKNRLLEQKRIIDECTKATSNDDLLYDFDFSEVINLLNSQNLSIDDIEKYIKEIKEVIEVRKLISSVGFSDEQMEAMNNLNNNLAALNDDVNKKLEEINGEKEVTSDISSLEELKRVLTDKDAPYTQEMFETFYKQFDFANMSDEDFESIVNGFKDTLNFQVKSKKEKESFENIIELFKEYLNPREFEKNGIFLKLLNAYEEEVCSNIDLENANRILEFFKEKKILKHFRREALLIICTYAQIDGVKKVYNEIMNNYPNEIDMYFESALAGAWLEEESSSKKIVFKSNKGKGSSKSSKSLRSKIKCSNNAELRRNIKLLEKYADIFVDKYDVRNKGAHLLVKGMNAQELEENLSTNRALLNLISSHNWVLKKNLELFGLFNIGSVYKVPVNGLDSGDIENKIHLAIELGLLNPPLDQLFRGYDSEINKNEDFLNLKNQQGIQNNTIRNYFARNTAVLAGTDINSFGFLFYRLKQFGYVDFYNYFFSEKSTGSKASYDIENDMRMSVKNKEDFITEKFITDFYDRYINKFDEYDIVISNSAKEFEGPYFDDDILEDELIKSIEEKNCIYDILNIDDKEESRKNEFVYKFGDTLISRYKVLHNASILKRVYGYLDKNMLISSIVRNSFLTEDTFKSIKDYLDEILEEGKTL